MRQTEIGISCLKDEKMAWEYEQHSFLKELGIEQENYGCFSGEWKGSGEEILSYNPTTNKVIAKVIAASEEDYEWSVNRCLDCKKLWASVSRFKIGFQL